MTNIESHSLEGRLGQEEPPYRSSGEAQVGRLLNRYGIPFVHELARVVQVRGRYRIWHPDFTLPTYGAAIIEYAGMPDRPDYMQGVRVKTRVYRENQIPALFLYPADLKGTNWPEQAIERIHCLRNSSTRGGYCRYS
jgi:hypothetical protein